MKINIHLKLIGSIINTITSKPFEDVYFYFSDFLDQSVEAGEISAHQYQLKMAEINSAYHDCKRHNAIVNVETPYYRFEFNPS